MIAICTYVNEETLMSLLEQIEQISSIMWAGSDAPDKDRDFPTSLDKYEQSQVEVLYYSEAWKGLMTYGPCIDHKGGYIATGNEEFVRVLAECLPK